MRTYVATFDPLAVVSVGGEAPALRTVMVIEADTYEEAEQAAKEQAATNDPRWFLSFGLDIREVAYVIRQGRGLSRGTYTAFNRAGKAVRVTIPPNEE